MMEALQVGQRVMVEMVVTQYSHWLDKNCDAKDFWCLKPVANGYGNGTITLHASDIHPLPAGEGWRGIATAPKDGTTVIVYRSDAGVFTAQYTEGIDGDTFWFTTAGEDLTFDMPTHWQPLPLPPPPQQTEPTP